MPPFQQESPERKRIKVSLLQVFITIILLSQLFRQIRSFFNRHEHRIVGFLERLSLLITQLLRAIKNSFTNIKPIEKLRSTGRIAFLTYSEFSVRGIFRSLWEPVRDWPVITNLPVIIVNIPHTLYVFYRQLRINLELATEAETPVSWINSR